MSADYAPGTVAVATVRGVEGVRVMRVANLDGWVDQFGYVHTPEGSGLDTKGPVTDVRPLVVLDLDTLVKPGTLATWLRHNSVCGSSAVADVIADQIEAQTKPPRIPEPGLWGVVEAGHRWIAGRHEWVRCGDSWFIPGIRVVPWDELIDPTLIRDGVTQ